MSLVTSQRVGAWGLRLLLALVLAFASVILVWRGVPGASALDWGVRVIGYPLLATLLLDVAVRYRIQDTYDAMTVFTGYGLLVALLIEPAVTYGAFPLTLLTRVLGWHTILGFEMFGLFVLLLAVQKRRYLLYLVGFAAWLGMYWGIWTRWQPVINELFPAVGLPSLALAAGAGIGLIGMGYVVVLRVSRSVMADDLLLSRVEWLVIVLLLLVLFMVQAAQETINAGMAGVTAIILVVCWGILWYRRDTDTGDAMMELLLPVTPLNAVWLLLATVVFGGFTVVGYSLPFFQFDMVNQLWLLEFYFAVGGALWLPIIASVIAVRGLDRQMRAWTGE